MSALLRSSPDLRPVVVRIRISAPLRHVYPSSPFVATYRSTCSLPYSIHASPEVRLSRTPGSPTSSVIYRCTSKIRRPRDLSERGSENRQSHRTDGTPGRGHRRRDVGDRSLLPPRVDEAADREPDRVRRVTAHRALLPARCRACPPGVAPSPPPAVGRDGRHRARRAGLRD